VTAEVPQLGGTAVAAITWLPMTRNKAYLNWIDESVDVEGSAVGAVSVHAQS